VDVDDGIVAVYDTNNNDKIRSVVHFHRTPQQASVALLSDMEATEMDRHRRKNVEIKIRKLKNAQKLVNDA